MNESEKMNKYLDLVRKQKKKLLKMRETVRPLVSGTLRTILNAWKDDWRNNNLRKKLAHLDHSIVRIISNSQKIPGNLKKPADT